MPYPDSILHGCDIWETFPAGPGKSPALPEMNTIPLGLNSRFFYLLVFPCLHKQPIQIFLILNLDWQALSLKIVYILFTIQHESGAQLIFESIFG
jgi:hypothetical protein